MKRRKTLCFFALFLTVILAMQMPFQVNATSTGQKIQQTESEKQQAENRLDRTNEDLQTLHDDRASLQTYLSNLNKELQEATAKLNEIEEIRREKEETIKAAQDMIEEAKVLQEERYEEMQKRIKFMYEKGDTYYVELLAEASSFSDILNKFDYIQMLSEYDHQKLTEYALITQYVETCKAELVAEKEVLDEAKAAVEAEEASLEELIAEKEGEIVAYQSDITTKAAAIAEYEAEIAEQNELIAALEAAVQAERKKLAEASGKRLTYDGGMFCFPAPDYTRISDDYGWRIHPILGTKQFHNGVDLAAPSGSRILAAYDGEVVTAAYSPSMGNYIMIDHGDNLYTIYMHASALYVSKGDLVGKGEKIAAVGSTGRSTGPHLHFTVRKNGAYESPWNYLK